jgi:hypothetical protein
MEELPQRENPQAERFLQKNHGTHSGAPYENAAYIRR